MRTTAPDPGAPVEDGVVRRQVCRLCGYTFEHASVAERERVMHSHYMRWHWLAAQREYEDSLRPPPRSADRPLAVSLPRTTENEND